jgi:signal peptidase II
MIPWITALVLILLDQLSKSYVVAHLADGRVHSLIGSLVQVVFVQNTRGAYGLFGDRPWFLIMIALVAFGVIWLAFRERAKRSTIVALALGAVLGGAIGNVADRLHYGFVVDFIRVTPLPFFEVFNVADMGITVGIATIVLSTLRGQETA